MILPATAFLLATLWNPGLAEVVTALGVRSIVLGLVLQDALRS
jgi:hypothetical protein